jgi:ComF family protein
LHEILAGIIDVIFPPHCITCGGLLEERGPYPFCPPCTAGITFIRSPLCPRCGIPFPTVDEADHLCGDCLVTQRPYDVMRSVGIYDKTLLTAIHLFKYRGKTGIGEVLGRMMADFAASVWSREAFSVILPVPLHKKRLRERGFNQAVILARHIARRFALPLDFLTLRREVGTDPQVGLGRDDRAANVRGAFAVRRPERIRGRKILLVDDVSTTGSTLTECASALLRAKAETVAVLTLARAVQDLGRQGSAPPSPRRGDGTHG